MSTVEFKPSDVVLTGIPLTGTLGRTEFEYTAATIIHTLALNGDVWRTVTMQEIVDMINEEAKKKGYWDSLLRNPFLRAEPVELCDAGYAEWDTEHSVHLTQKCLDAIKPWVKA